MIISTPVIHAAEYVSAGGAYLGLCAGAYYACSRVEFEPGGPLQVRGDRELGFFPGVAAGAAYAGGWLLGMYCLHCRCMCKCACCTRQAQAVVAVPGVTARAT
jgi:hypothetical protein